MRTIVLIDGQNLFHLAREAWGPAAPYDWPSYDVLKLADTLVALTPGRTLAETRFYTGVPDRQASPHWHDFWNQRLRYLQRRGVQLYRGRVNQGGEKGVDVSLALDLVRATYEQRYDASIIVSQDADFAPAVDLSREIAASQGRTLDFESAFPFSAGKVNPRGVPRTRWVHIDQGMYDSCLDLYRRQPRNGDERNAEVTKGMPTYQQIIECVRRRTGRTVKTCRPKVRETLGQCR